MNQIQWYPGHMAKAKRLVTEKLPLVDIVYELLDARIPYSSANPMLQKIIENKPRLVILNKADLADPRVTSDFISYFRDRSVYAYAVNSLTGNPLPEIIRLTKEILTDLRAKEKAKGMKSRPFRGMVLGIPNVGKSQFINKLAGKNKTKTGNIPGMTRTQTFLKAGSDLILLDNPGILWPKFEDQQVGMNLALVGSIKETTYDIESVARFGLEFLVRRYPERLKTRYELDQDQLASLSDLVDAIGKRRGCLLPGGEIDIERVYNLFLYDFRNQMFGPLSLERVETDV
ncbi:MAG: ribosome biogenesis GTPase YlqF [Bacilli bacterium]|nr:ribosome biogenesis GTPase YlqF [Bacilli bacterium]